jgi:hypothetical protein
MKEYCDWDLDTLVKAHQKIGNLLYSRAVEAEDTKDIDQSFVYAMHAWAHFRLAEDVEGMAQVETEYFFSPKRKEFFSDRSPELKTAKSLADHMLNLKHYDEEIIWLTLAKEESYRSFSLPDPSYIS